LEIADHEKRLSALEIEQQQSHEELAGMASRVRGTDYQELAKSIAARQITIDDLYDKLNDLVQERDRKYNAFNID
jgi:hypothetical protein